MFTPGSRTLDTIGTTVVKIDSNSPIDGPPRLSGGASIACPSKLGASVNWDVFWKMANESPWKLWFQNWPKDLPPRGVLVVKFGEQIPFDGFLATDEMVVVERRAPDTIGARKVLATYDQICAVKFTDVVRGKLFEPLGFSGKLKD